MKEKKKTKSFGAKLRIKGVLSIFKKSLRILNPEPGVNSGLQVLDTFAAAADSLEPEIIQRPNSLLAPDFAIAKPGLALLAGLALAVLWKYKIYGPKCHEMEDCVDSEWRDSEDDRETDMNGSEDDLSDSEDDLQMDMSDSDDDFDFETDVNDTEDDFEPDMSDGEDDSETEMSLVSRLEDSLELEDSDNDLETEISNVEDEEMEVMDQEIQLPGTHRDQPDVEKQMLKEALENSQVYGSRMEHLWKEAMEETVWLQNQLLDKDILLEKNAQDGADMKREIETMYLQKEQILTEKRRLEDDLELAQDRGERTEKLYKELMEKTASLQQAMVDKEIELESTIENGTKLGLKLKETETFNQVLASEKEYFERLIEDYTDALAKEQRKVENLQELLARKAIESEKDQDKLRTLEAEVQVMKNWVAELGGQNARHLEEVEENHLEITLLKKTLRKEKQRNRILQDALRHGKETEKLLEDEKKKGNEMETFLRTLKVELDNKDLQIENFLDTERKLICEKEELQKNLSVALNHGKELNSLLEEADEKSRTIANNFEEEVQKRENQIRDLLAQEEKLKGEKLVLEDKLEKAVNLLMTERMEQERANSHWQQKLQEKDKEVETLREHQRRLEEALKDQDKYMLMTLLHGTAQRNFHLQHIALQHGNEILDISEKERQEEDLQMRMEKQYRKYCDTQRERTNYGNQWEVLTHTLMDIVHGDERMPEATTGDPNKNCEIFNENLADKTCHQSNETHKEKEG
ncbi:cingulin-like [Macrobrachium rosenbergii]|uniref:cingulin-like n=1 Tax=Macrobrachium rosenbergii TaxID=79674 RepID=UPI0034D5EE13